MTLILAAIGSDGIVCLGDNMSSTPTETFHGVEKIFDLAPNWSERGGMFLLNSGDAGAGNNMIEQCMRDYDAFHPGEFDRRVSDSLIPTMKRQFDLNMSAPLHEWVRNAFIVTGYRQGRDGELVPDLRVISGPPAYPRSWTTQGWSPSGVALPVVDYVMRAFYRRDMCVAQLKVLLAFVHAESHHNSSNIVGPTFSMQIIRPDRREPPIGPDEKAELMVKVRGSLRATAELFPLSR